MKPRVKKILMIAPIAVLGIAALGTLMGYGTMWLWNTVPAAVFGWPTLTFWQALGLLLLCRVLFGGSGMRSSMRSNMRHRMRERCMRMSPEERERFRERMRERWHRRDERDEGTPV